MDISLYLVSIILLSLSFYKDKNKTKKALIKAWKSLNKILPQFLTVIVIVGIMLSVFDTKMISKIIGAESGWYGILISSIIGSITLIPGFVAFPTASMLIKNGAGYIQIATFISTLMMVGIITAPVEMQYFGKKMTLARNFLAFIFSFFVAFVIGKVVVLI